jgi:hypothetical protein
MTIAPIKTWQECPAPVAWHWRGIRAIAAIQERKGGYRVLFNYLGK